MVLRVWYQGRWKLTTLPDLAFCLVVYGKIYIWHIVQKTAGGQCIVYDIRVEKQYTDMIYYIHYSLVIPFAVVEYRSSLFFILPVITVTSEHDSHQVSSTLIIL